MKYKCEKCNKMFNLKGDYLRHIDRKKPCDLESGTDCEFCDMKFSKYSNLRRHILSNHKDNHLKNEPQEDGFFECEDCLKKFNRRDNLTRHQKEFCCETMGQDPYIKEQFSAFLRELMENYYDLREPIVTHSSNLNSNNDYSNNQIHSNNTNCNNQIHNFNIQLNAFGKEDISFLTDDDYKTILNKGFRSIQELVRSIHFNQKKPENQNIFISNMKDAYANVFDGKEWILMQKNDVIDDLYSTKKDILQEKYNELSGVLPEYTKNKFDRFNGEEHLNHVQTRVKQEIKLLLYNSKKIPLATKIKIQ